MLVANVLAKDSGKAAISARMRLALAERPGGTDFRMIGSHAHPGLFHSEFYFVLAHHEVQRTYVVAVSNDKIECCVQRILVLHLCDLRDRFPLVLSEVRTEDRGDQHSACTSGTAPQVVK